MVYDHKTAPSIVIGEDAEKLLPYQRTGFHAQLPLGSPRNRITMMSMDNVNLSAQVADERAAPGDLSIDSEQSASKTAQEVGRGERSELVTAARLSSRCHPDRPRINPQGHCLECALALQARRVR